MPSRRNSGRSPRFSGKRPHKQKRPGYPFWGGPVFVFKKLHASRTAAGGTKKAASGLRILCGVLCVSACDKKGSIKHAGLWIMTEEKNDSGVGKSDSGLRISCGVLCVSACDKKESIKCTDFHTSAGQNKKRLGVKITASVYYKTLHVPAWEKERFIKYIYFPASACRNKKWFGIEKAGLRFRSR